MGFRFVIALLALPGLLGGCDAVRPVRAQAAGAIPLEVALFEGGYGIEWHRAMAERFAAENPAVRIDLWGDPRVEHKLKPRLLQGAMPDLMHERNLPMWLLIANGKLLPFNDALTRPAPGDDRPWGDLFYPGTLDMYVTGGDVWAVPSALNAWACWYDARMFREHGWEPPKTWAEFDALCTAIRAAGIEPVAYQGKYPIYGWWTFISLVQRVGGLEAVNRINRCEPGCFSHPDVVRAAALMQDFAVKHYQRGALAMNHTESQAQFVLGKAAMVFCGLWLDNEMKDTTPPGFEMRAFPMPAVEGGKGNPRLIQASGWEFFIVPTDAAHPEAGFDFVRYMVSPQNAPSMGEQIGVISPIRGGTPKEAVTPALGSAIDMIDAAEGLFAIRAEFLLLDWRNDVLVPEIGLLFGGAKSPEAVCAALDRGMQESLAKRDIPLPAAIAYDSAAYGEPLP